MDDSIYRPYKRLVAIKILGRSVEVPENNVLLRCFQYLCPETIVGGRFCWNNECGNSKFYYRMPADTEDRKSRACCFVVKEGMEITALSAELKWVLREILKRPADAALVDDEDEPIPIPTFKSQNS